MVHAPEDVTLSIFVIEALSTFICDGVTLRVTSSVTGLQPTAITARTETRAKRILFMIPIYN